MADFRQPLSDANGHEFNRRHGLPTEQADCLDALGTIACHDGLLEFDEQMHVEAMPLRDLAPGVAGTDLDPGAVHAAALDGLGETQQAESLRRQWIEWHGESAFADESKRLP